MLFREFFTHYPSRLLWVGGGILSFFICLFGIFLHPMADQPHFPLPPRRNAVNEALSPLPSLRLQGEAQRRICNLASLKEGLMISLSPSRPDSSIAQSVAQIRLKGSNQSKRILLPGRIDLVYQDREGLCFHDRQGPFWLELSLEQGVAIATGSVMWTGTEEKVSFSRKIDDPILQKAEEFSPGTPWRALGELRWWGPDAVAQLDDATKLKQMLEMGSMAVALKEQDWICWKEGKWCKGELQQMKGLPIAKIRSVSAQMLEWDGWGEDPCSHVRLGTPLQSSALYARPKIEELLTAIRIRSEKQISCILEKQCLILRVGELVFKDRGRWRILRKAEEKQQVLCGEKIGELLVIDQIECKQGMVKGRFFPANRTQVVPIELVALNVKREKPLNLSKRGA